MATRLFGQVGKLKKEKIQEYRELHANAWPGVLETIRKCHLEHYSIFIQGSLVFSYYEYTGEDYERDMELMAADPVTQEWWKHTQPCFETYAVSPGSEFYHDMEQIFYLQ